MGAARGRVSMSEAAILLVVVVAIIAVPIILIGIYAVVVYNSLIRIRNHIDESWSDVETEMQRRYDLIPNLVSTAKGYATHEKGLLEEVARLREQARADHGSPKHQAQTEGLLDAALGRLMVRLEAYPELKANRNFLELQEELTNTENRIQAAYRFYNGNVREYNNKVQMFPSNIFAGIFGFKEREYFELQEEAARQAPKVQF
jgi:LemA protein